VTGKRVIYPAMRAAERAMALDGMRPRRLFGVLWPLWRVDVQSELYEPQAYEVLDRFLSRGIATAEMSTVDELACFLGLEPPLVVRVLGFLTTIQHVREVSGRYQLTNLGQRSLAADVRYVLKKGRQYLLFDRATLRPLPRDHYGGEIILLDEPEMPGPGIRFRPLYSATEFRPEMVGQLAARADRADYNLRPELVNPEITSHREVYLPAYLVETASKRTPYLVYTAAPGERDAFLESLCGDRSVVASLARAEEARDPRPLWERWLTERDQPTSALRELPGGGWRATLAAAAYEGAGAALGVHRIGSYQVHQQYFMQLWCENDALREAAVLNRVTRMGRGGLLRDKADLCARLAELARQLEVAEPSVAGLVRYLGDPDQAAWVRELGYG
jgi:hypothetical protein